MHALQGRDRVPTNQLLPRDLLLEGASNVTWITKHQLCGLTRYHNAIDVQTRRYCTIPHEKGVRILTPSTSPSLEREEIQRIRVRRREPLRVEGQTAFPGRKRRILEEGAHRTVPVRRHEREP